MASNFTQNIGLNQWQRTDPFTVDDFNADNAKIDAALGSAGNCRIAAGSYVGTGEYGAAHPNTIQLPFPAQLIMMDVSTKHNYNATPEYYIAFRQAASFMAPDTSSGSNSLTWTNSSVSWYYTGTGSDGPKYQFNISGQTYHYILIG